MTQSSLQAWLRPGMKVKRWIALLLLALTATSLAMAMGARWLYDNYEVPTSVQDTVSFLTLQFIPHPLRGLLILAAGLALIPFAIWKLTHSIVAPVFEETTGTRSVTDILVGHRFGPKNPPEFSVVTIGGGTGLGYVLRGLKQANISLTAIVTVADDGGSTGRLRADFDIPAPGDIRNCLVSLANDESTMGKLFNHRFVKEGSDLSGHSFGNLFIAAMSQLTGNFEAAIEESARVLDIRGRVLPSTLEYVTLCAHMTDGSTVRGESRIPHRQPADPDHALLAGEGVAIQEIFLEPKSIDAYMPALAAIQNADLIVLGPGSLFTSVLPNLLVDGVTDAIHKSRGATVYVCNVATQEGETDRYGYADHVQQIVRYLGDSVLDLALVNSNPASASAIGPEDHVEAVIWDGLKSVHGVEIVARDVVSESNPLRHDPNKLASVLLELVRSRSLAVGLAPPFDPEREAVAAEIELVGSGTTQI